MESVREANPTNLVKVEDVMGATAEFGAREKGEGEGGSTLPRFLRGWMLEFSVRYFVSKITGKSSAALC